MSGLIPIGISVAAAEVLDLLNPVMFLQRNIGGFIADVTIEEVHTDLLEVTEHPVEQGAAVTDHAFIKPANLLIKAGWSNSSLQAGGDPNYVNDTYQNFLDLQASRQPFDIITGKRSYQNMLFTRLTTRSDDANADAMVLEIECREIITVNTQTVTVPNANQATPTETGNVANQGSVSPMPVGTGSGNSVVPTRVIIRTPAGGS